MASGLKTPTLRNSINERPNISIWESGRDSNMLEDQGRATCTPVQMITRNSRYSTLSVPNNSVGKAPMKLASITKGPPSTFRVNIAKNDKARANVTPINRAGHVQFNKTPTVAWAANEPIKLKQDISDLPASSI